MEKRRKILESIVFDFDGTLAELRLDFPDMKRKLTVLARGFLPSLSADAGMPALELMKEFELQIGSAATALAAKYRSEAEALITGLEMAAAREGSLFPFTRGMLSSLRERGVRTAVITRNCEQAVRVVFPDIDAYCSAFLARNHVPNPKPDPGHLLLALDAIGAGNRSRSLIVGDHPLDIRTGILAGIRTAGVGSGNTPLEVLAACGADYTAENCELLIGLLAEEGLI